MSLARELVEVEGQLRERATVDLFSAQDTGSLLSTPEYATILARLAATGPADHSTYARLCLQALRIQYEEFRPKLLDAELVATLPADSPGIARPTQAVVREMIDRARAEVILLGYEFTDRDSVQLLADARARGANIIVICDRGRGSSKLIADAWPAKVPRPRIFNDRKRADGARYASMHAKCLLIDGSDLLVTSANFTFHGLRGNIEIGIRLSGPPAEEARKIFSHLVENGLVEERQ